MALWFASTSQATSLPKPSRPSLTFFFLLVGAFLLTLVPHVIELPVWLSLAILVSLVIRSVVEVYRLPLPSTTFCSLVALCLLFGIVLQFHTMFGRDAGLAFTAGLLAIKFFEIRGPRDIALIIFSGFFLVMCSLLYSQVIELFIYCLIMMWVLTALLLRLQIGDLPEDHLLPMLKWAGMIFLQALPLTIFLFFFFPRYSGKLEVNLGETSLGFSDTVKPGDIASLSQSTAEAMYVTFLRGEVPLTESMYWRGLVLWDYHDGAWTAGKLGEIPLISGEQPSSASGSDLIEQEITIYPHFQKWLFALDYPVSPAVDASEPQPWSTVYNGDILQLVGDKTKVDHRERYTVVSSFALNEQTLTPDEAEAGIRLPGDSPKDDPTDLIDADVRRLAASLHRENPDAPAYVRAVLLLFRQEHFVYTVSPGVQGKRGKWLHTFLFTSRAGFCEHFASAFAVLMRLEQIPARVVVGYHGADYNPYKNIYIVKQANAHAWDEVWIDARVQSVPGKRMGRWQRIDPTAALPALGNIQSNPNGAPQESPTDELSIQVSQHRMTFSEAYLPGWMHRGIVEMQLRREQVEADWDDLVFAYDPTAQNRLAQALGLGRNATFYLVLACAISMGVCVMVFQKWMRRKPPVTPVENLYAAFCRNMAQRGVPRATWEGPLAYTGRVAEAFPEKEAAIRDLGSIIARARYGPVPLESTEQAKLKSLLLLITVSQAASSSRDQT